MTEAEFMGMIAKENYNCLEIIGLYLSFIEKQMMPFTNFSKTTIKTGTKLYRIRNYHEETDYNNNTEWKPNPKPKINRCNRDNEISLYLGSDEEICLLEANIKSDNYVLGEYEVIEDIICGRFNRLYYKDYLSIIDVFLNAFLIANNHSEILDEMPFDVKSFNDIKTNDFISVKAPFMIGKAFENQKIDNNSDYYNLTNKICDIIKHNYQAIRYGSCYIPMESPIINISSYNLVLFSDEIDKVQFRSASIKQTNLSEIKNRKIELMKSYIKEN